MFKKIFKSKVGRAVTGVVGGLLGVGGGTAAGLDVEAAVAIGATALVLIAAGPEAATFFHNLVTKKSNDSHPKK